MGATDVVFRFPSSVWTAPFLLDRAQDELWASGRFSSVTGPLDAGGRYLPPRAVARLYATLGPPQRLPLVYTKALGRSAGPALRRLPGHRAVRDGGRPHRPLPDVAPGGLGGEHGGDAGNPVRACSGVRRRSIGWGDAMGSGRTGTRRGRRQRHLGPGRGAHPPGRGAGPGLAPRTSASQRGGTALPRRQCGALLHGVARPRRAHLRDDWRAARDQLHAAVLHVRLHHGSGRGLQHPRHEQDQGGDDRAPPPSIGPSCSRHNRDNGHDGRTDSGRHVRRARR